MTKVTLLKEESRGDVENKRQYRRQKQQVQAFNPHPPTRKPAEETVWLNYCYRVGSLGEDGQNTLRAWYSDSNGLLLSKFWVQVQNSTQKQRAAGILKPGYASPYPCLRDRLRPPGRDTKLTIDMISLEVHSPAAS